MHSFETTVPDGYHTTNVVAVELPELPREMQAQAFVVVGAWTFGILAKRFLPSPGTNSHANMFGIRLPTLLRTEGSLSTALRLTISPRC